MRSGKQIDNQVSSHPVPNKSVSTPPVLIPPTQNDPSSSSQPSISKSNKKDKTDKQPYKPIVPFPNRLANQKLNAHMEKIREMFNQVQINVPLLDAIQQVPSYAKFLKEMCTKKRKANVPKKVFLASNMSCSLGQFLFLQRNFLVILTDNILLDLLRLQIITLSYIVTVL